MRELDRWCCLCRRLPPLQQRYSKPSNKVPWFEMCQHGSQITKADLPVVSRLLFLDGEKSAQPIVARSVIAGANLPVDVRTFVEKRKCVIVSGANTKSFDIDKNLAIHFHTNSSRVWSSLVFAFLVAFWRHERRFRVQVALGCLWPDEFWWKDDVLR